MGAELVIPRLRRLACRGLIALLVAVFPANVHMALHGFRAVPDWVSWALLALQGVFITRAY